MTGPSESTGSNRHQGREVALQVLYAVDLAGHTSPRRAQEALEAGDAFEDSEAPNRRPEPTVVPGFFVGL